MTEYDTTIDPFLTAFGTSFRSGKPPEAARRIAYLERLLRGCVEEQMDKIECVECRAALIVEEAFNPVNPVATVMKLDQLLWILGYFVHSPWLRSDAVMQAEQWRFVKAIVDAVLRTPHFREDFLTPNLERQITSLREHVTHGLRYTSEARGPRALER